MKKTVALLLCALTVAMPFVVATPSQASAASEVLLVYHTAQECETLTALISACGMPVRAVQNDTYTAGMAGDYEHVVTTSTKPLKDATEAVLCVGERFPSTQEITFERRQNLRVTLDYAGCSQPARFESQILLIVEANGETFGELQLISGETYPFAVIGENHIYAPYYRADDWSALVLGGLLREYLGETQQSSLYILVDEVYPFSNLGMVCALTDALYENAIPFVLRIMPVYDNLDYPAFLRYAQVLRYVQAHNGSIVLHSPVVEEQEMEREALYDKLLRFYTALEEQHVRWFDMTYPPYVVDLECVESLMGATKNLLELPLDAMIALPLPQDQKELDEYIVLLNAQWLSIADYKRKFTDENYQYKEVAVDDQYDYIQEEEKNMESFFSAGNMVLVFAVGAGLAVFAVLLVVGYRLYKKKFFR